MRRVSSEHQSILSPEHRWAIFLDLDGTLFARDHTVPEQNLQAIAAAQAMGHMVFLNTGRSMGYLPRSTMETVRPDGIITGNGAMVEIRGKICHRAFFPASLVERVTDFVFSHPGHWALLEGVRRTYSIFRDDPRHIPIQTPEDLAQIWGDDSIQVIALGDEAPREFMELFRDDLSVMQTAGFADVSLIGNSKAAGMEKVLEVTGILREHTLAIGDSSNDLDMLRYAAMGVAMENSRPELLQAADYITSSNLEAGVAAALEHFHLCPPLPAGK